jgi:hypothetical protein
MFTRETRREKSHTQFMPNILSTYVLQISRQINKTDLYPVSPHNSWLTGLILFNLYIGGSQTNLSHHLKFHKDWHNVSGTSCKSHRPYNWWLRNLTFSQKYSSNFTITSFYLQTITESACQNCYAVHTFSHFFVCGDVDIFRARNVLPNRFYNMLQLLLLLFART